MKSGADKKPISKISSEDQDPNNDSQSVKSSKNLVFMQLHFTFFLVVVSLFWFSCCCFFVLVFLLLFLCFGFLVVVSLFWFSFFFVAVACFLFMFILFCEKIGKQTRILLLSRHHAKTPFNEAVQNNSNFLLYFCSSKNTSWKKQQSVCLSVVPGSGDPGT